MSNKKRLKEDSENSKSQSESESVVEQNVKSFIKNELPEVVTKSQRDKLVYNSANNEDEKPIKLQFKSQKKEVKVQKSQLVNEEQGNRKSLMFNVLQNNKKNVQKLPYPPPKKQIPLAGKGQQKNDLLKEMKNQAKMIMMKMKQTHKKDQQLFKQGQTAIHKLKYLSTLQQKLKNIYIKRAFVQSGGLKYIQLWLDTIQDKNGDRVEPSFTLKIGVLTLLKNMSLISEELSKTKNLVGFISKNRQSQIIGLRQLAQDLHEQWQYVMTVNQ